MASGVYSESISLRAGVAVYGGYSGDFYHRDRGTHRRPTSPSDVTHDAPP